MESKTKHRILGIVVVAGLAILMYPFVQGGNNIPGEQVMIKAPPFPDQAIQVASNENEAVANTPADTIAQGPVNAAQPSAEQVEATNAPQPDAAMNQENPNVVNVAAPTQDAPASATATAANAAPEANPAGSAAAPEAQKNALSPAVQSSLQSLDQPESQADEQSLPNGPTALSADVGNADLDGPSVDDIPAVNTAQEAPAKAGKAQPAKASKKQVSVKKAAKQEVAVKSHAHKKMIKTAKANLAKPVIYSKIASKSGITAYRQMPIDNNGLVQLKQAAYVIQLGSFTEKTNALKLVNKLRAKGYRAFIQHTPGSVGENTRVFVGPEKQQASARLVATELEKEMQLHGIVISYKPFSL